VAGGCSAGLVATLCPICDAMAAASVGLIQKFACSDHAGVVVITSRSPIWGEGIDINI
jgi:hypothetical protein